MRLFIAINLSDRNKKLINNKVKLIKNNVNEKVKWVKKENWHMTIKFLGDVNKNRLSIIKEKINEIKDFNKFYFQIKSLDAFPNINYPKVIYLGVHQGKNKLIKIHEDIEKKMFELNFEKEKRDFTPHITIGRSKDYSNIDKLANSLNEFNKQKHFINIYSKVENISLMKSELTQKGPEYEEIFSKNIK